MEELLQFETGGLLVRQGDVECHAFLIESGSVKIVVRDGDREQVLAIAGIGEAVGEMALFDDAPRSANVIALERTLAKRMTREDLGELMQTDPSACMAYLRAVFDRLRTSNTMLLVARQTQELIKTTRVRLSLEPISEAALQVCPKTAMIELDIIPSESSAQILLQGLQKHFKVEAQAFLPQLQR